MNSPSGLEEELKSSPRAVEASPMSDKRVRVKRKASQSSFFDTGHIGVADDTSDEENENSRRLFDADENDDSDYVPSSDNHSKAAKNKVKGRGRPSKKMTGHKSDIEQKIEFAEKRIESLSEYEKIRLGNLKDRLDLQNDLNLSKQKDEEEGNDKVFVPPGQKIITISEEEGTDETLSDNVLPVPPVMNTSVGETETSAICQDSTKYTQYSGGCSFPPPKQPRMLRPVRPLLKTWRPVGYSGHGLGGIRKRLDATAIRPNMFSTMPTNVTRKTSFRSQSTLLPIQFNNNPPSSPVLDRLSNYSGVTVKKQSPPPTPTTSWNIPPGITVSKTISETKPAITLNSLATALKMLGQVEGERRVVRFMLTEGQINALKTLGIGHI